MTNEERNIKIVKGIPFMYDLDPTHADEIFAQDCVHHINGVTENGTGPEFIKVSIYEMAKVFDGSQTTFNDMIASGDKVAVRWIWKGKKKIVEYWATDNRYLEMLNHGFKIVPPSLPTTK